MKDAEKEQQKGGNLHPGAQPSLKGRMTSFKGSVEPPLTKKRGGRSGGRGGGETPFNRKPPINKNNATTQSPLHHKLRYNTNPVTTQCSPNIVL